MSNPARARVSPKKAKQALENRAVLDLRAAGNRLEDIAETLEVSTTTAWNWLQRAYREIKHPQSQELLDLELYRLDIYLAAIWPKVEKGDLGAIDRAIEIGKRRARLLKLELTDGTIQVNIVQLLQAAAKDSISIRGGAGMQLPPIGEPLPVLSARCLTGESQPVGEVVDAESVSVIADEPEN